MLDILSPTLPIGENQFSINEPYFIIEVNAGSEFFESDLLFAKSSIAKQDRIPLSDVELLSLFIHSGALLDPFRTARSYYAALGTKYVLSPSDNEINSFKKELIPTFDLQFRRLVLVEENTKKHMLYPSRGNIIV